MQSGFQIRRSSAMRNEIRTRICRTHLETQDQPPHGLLSTCRHAFACATAPCGSYPSWPNGCDGDFLRLLSRRTALRHKPSRNMVGALSSVPGASSARGQQYPRCRVKGKHSARHCSDAQSGLPFSFLFDRLQFTEKSVANWPLASIACKGVGGSLNFVFSFSSFVIWSL